MRSLVLPFLATCLLAAVPSAHATTYLYTISAWTNSEPPGPNNFITGSFTETDGDISNVDIRASLPRFGSTVNIVFDEVVAFSHNQLLWLGNHNYYVATMLCCSSRTQ
jgi:hypothetical protein